MAVDSPPMIPNPKRLRWADVREQLTGYLFIAPAVIIISVFGLFPIGYAFYMSMYRWRVRQGKFLLFDNYLKAVGDWEGALLFAGGFVVLVVSYLALDRAFKSKNTSTLAIGSTVAFLLFAASVVSIMTGWNRMMATGDEDFLNALPITVYYALGTVPLEIALALVLAFILYQKIRGQEFFRMLYFLPYITPAVAAATVFRVLFSQRDTAIANQLLSLFGIAPQKWLQESERVLYIMFPMLEERLINMVGPELENILAGPSMALVSVVIFGVWTYVGYNTVIFLAGLGSIPSSLYEAAEIDGANTWQSFRHITLPLLSPVTFYLVLIAFIGTFKAFNHIYVMRHPLALDTLNTASIVIFDTFYKENNFSYATAQAFILFAIILGLTLAQNKIIGERVFYG